MSERSQFSRRRFLAAGTAALAAPAILSRFAWGGPDLKPVSDANLRRIEAALPEKAAAQPKKKRKILVFYRCEGFVHGGAINHSIPALTMMGEKTGAYSVELSNEMSAFDPGALDGFDAVVFNNTSALKFENEKHRETLMEFVKGGRGVCGIHAATDNFYNWPEAAEMMGGLFDGHPWGGGGTWAVKIDEPDHVLNRAFGGKGFWIKDEIYKFRHPYSRERLRILVSLDMSKPQNVPGRPDGDNAISWLREFEKGRVFYCSLGHNDHIFWTPAVLKHYLDGFQYALGDLAADATPSAKLASLPEPALAPDEPKELERPA